RNRSRANYVQIMSYESDEDEFLIDGPELQKAPKGKRVFHGDDECGENASPTALPLKPGNKTKPSDFVASQNRRSTRTRKSAPNSTEGTPQLLTKQPLFSVPEIAPSSNTESGPKKTRSYPQAKQPNNSPPSIEPLTPLNRTPALVCVTSSSALRLGLSRKNIRKTLHPNIRLSR
ncbi:hypothetical protein TSMEX_010966, partial [Taenia solium]